MQKITPCLWFDNNAEEAVNFYTSIFKNSKISQTTYYGEGMPMPKGTILTIYFQLDGQEFMALNAGPVFKFNEAISLMVNCKDQEELDRFWEKLSEGGQKVECGWLKDKFGLSWQIIPTILVDLMKDPAKADKIMHAVMKMKKLDIKKLEEAAKG